MKELVTEEQAVFAIRLIACLAPPLGLLVGWLISWLKKRPLKLYLAYGLLAGLSGPFILLMWSIYIGVVDHYGLDSVKMLLLNLGLFVLAGLTLGFLLAWIVPRLRSRLGGASPGRRLKKGKNPARRKRRK